MRKPISITLEGEMVEEIDEKRGAVPRSRFIELLILRAVQEDKKEEVGTGYA